MRRWLCTPACLLLFSVAGCHSHYIQAALTNGSQRPLNVIQVEYPSASFGTQLLAPGATFRYRFKLLGSGHVKVSYIDAANKEHDQTGPWLNEGQEGQLKISLTDTGAVFQTSLRP